MPKLGRGVAPEDKIQNPWGFLPIDQIFNYQAKTYSYKIPEKKP